MELQLLIPVFVLVLVICCMVVNTQAMVVGLVYYGSILSSVVVNTIRDQFQASITLNVI